MLITVGAAVDTTGIFTLQTADMVLFLPAYACGAYARSRRSSAGLAVCLIGTEAAVAVLGTGAYWALFALGTVTASWAVGKMMGTHRALVVSLTRTQQLMRDEQDHLERLAIIDERERIAFDLQAIVADCLTKMTDYSWHAQTLLESDPARAEETIAEIERTGQGALDEMRRLLDLLRDEKSELILTPQPGVGQLRSLITDARSRGWHVEFTTDGIPRPLPATVNLAIYRTVEYALLGSRAASDFDRVAKVAVVFESEGVRLEIAGRATPERHCSVTIEERIALAGGSSGHYVWEGMDIWRLWLPTTELRPVNS